MNIVHSGFDSLYFSIQGALSPGAIEWFERLKAQAISETSDVPFDLSGHPNRYHMKTTGKKGGYTYVINTGLVGSTLAFKTSLSRDQHNGFVEISSASLLAHGWRLAVTRALDHVAALGFHVVECSVNRVDYCIDFLDAPTDIDARDFIAHARVKKSCYHAPASVSEHVVKRSVAQSYHVKSITLGKMPGRQVVVYDKRAEVIEKRKLYWFDAWGIERRDNTRTVHRVEVRAGKQHLLKNRIRTLEDFERHIGLVLQDAVRAIRWVRHPRNDANVTRAPLHPVWKAVQTHMEDALRPYTLPLTVEVITDRMRENKRLEYRQQIVGNLGGWLGCGGVGYSDMNDAVDALMKDITSSASCEPFHPLFKSYSRTWERWHG